MKWYQYLNPLNWFKKKSSGTTSANQPTGSVPTAPNPVETEGPSASSIKKLAIIIGHGNGDSGAMGWNGVEEFKYNSKVAEIVKAANTGKNIKLFWRGSTGIVGVAAEAVLWGPDASIELHLNAYNGKAIGCEVLVLSGDSKSGELGKSFAKEFTTKFNRVLRRDQGINWISSGDRGGASLKAVSPIKQSILVEPFFIDTRSEWIEPGVYAQFLIDWIKKI